MADIVITVGSDTSGASRGFAAVANDAQAMSGKTKQTFNQAAFAAQDFAVVLQQGGSNSLGRALMGASNNIGVMGAALGPWGLAIATGIAILAPLAPSLFDTATALDKVKEKLAATEKMRGAMQGLAEDSIRFRNGVSGMSSESIKGAIWDRETDIEVLQSRMKKAVAIRDEMLLAEDEAGKVFVSGSDKMESLDDIQKNFRSVKMLNSSGSDLGSAAKLDPEIKKALEEVAVIQEQIKERERQITTLRNAAPGAERKKRMEEEKKEAEKLAEAHTKAATALEKQKEHLFEITRTPVEKFQTEMGKLNRDRGRGLLDDDTYDRRAKQLADEAKKALQGGKTESGAKDAAALQQGSSEQIDAVNKARNADREILDEQLSELKRILDELKKQTDLARDADKPAEGDIG